MFVFAEGFIAGVGPEGSYSAELSLDKSKVWIYWFFVEIYEWLIHLFDANQDNMMVLDIYVPAGGW